MIALARNLLSAVHGMVSGARRKKLTRQGREPTVHTSSWFIVMPFDAGLWRLRTDSYLALAEGAQVHFYTCHGLAWQLLTSRVAVITKSVSTKHLHPVKLWQRVVIRTRVHLANHQEALFLHDFYVEGRLCASVEVVTVYRQGKKPVDPAMVLQSASG